MVSRDRRDPIVLQKVRKQGSYKILAQVNTTLVLSRQTAIFSSYILEQQKRVWYSKHY